MYQGRNGSTEHSKGNKTVPEKVATTRRGWIQTDYQNKHYNMKQRDQGMQDDRGRDGGTNYILRIKEQETHLNLHEHDDDEDDDEKFPIYFICCLFGIRYIARISYSWMILKFGSQYFNATIEGTQFVCLKKSHDICQRLC